MNNKFLQEVSDLFNEKIKKKDFTIPRTEKDVWGNEVAVINGENVERYKLETWCVSIGVKDFDSPEDIANRALKQLIPAEELHLPDVPIPIYDRDYRHIDGYKIYQLCEWQMLTNDRGYFVGKIFDEKSLMKGFTYYIAFVKYAKILEDKYG